MLCCLAGRGGKHIARRVIPLDRMLRAQLHRCEYLGLKRKKPSSLPMRRTEASPCLGLPKAAAPGLRYFNMYVTETPTRVGSST